MKKEIDLLDKEISENVQPKQRPVFLTVLCILTFSGTGLIIIVSLFSIVVMGQLESVMEDFNETYIELDSKTDLGNSYRWTKISYILNIVGSLLCLVGALIMWKLRKYGYYIYIVGQVLPLIGTFMVMNSMFSGNFGEFTIFSSIFSMIFPVVFIIMYGLNLKHMK